MREFGAVVEREIHGSACVEVETGTGFVAPEAHCGEGCESEGGVMEHVLSALRQRADGRSAGACGDPVCDGENLRRIGDVFERYGSFGEEDALVGVGGC